MATATIATPSTVLQFPRVPTTQISQNELAEFVGAQKTLEKLQKHVDALEASLLARLRAGEVAEEGVYAAEVKRSTRRSPAWKDIVKRLAGRLVLDGDAYCSNVITHTKSSESFSLEVR